MALKSVNVDYAAGMTIAEAKRQATVEQILLAARQLVMERGLDVTMDELAEGTGVARRTLFRHFETRERLLAQSLEAGIQRYGELLPSFDPTVDGGWRSWLHELCQSAHRMQADYGPGYWELTSRADLAADIAAVEDRRRVRRRSAMERIARKLWHEAGGTGDAPPAVTAAVGASLSPRFTTAVIVDVGQPWMMAADLAESAILAAVESAADSVVGSAGESA